MDRSILYLMCISFGMDKYTYLLHKYVFWISFFLILVRLYACNEPMLIVLVST